MFPHLPSCCCRLVPAAAPALDTCYCCCWCSAPAPTQASGAGGSDWTDLDLLSVSNVPPRSPRFWAHLITAYIITGVALYVSICAAFGRGCMFGALKLGDLVDYLGTSVAWYLCAVFTSNPLYIHA
jgi:hypothetical protein